MLSSNTVSQNLTLSLSHIFKAPRDKVFTSWTDPAILTQWFGPKEVSIEEVQVDLRVGGKYSFVMKGPDRKLVTIGGTYNHIEPPEKLVFTWDLDPDGCSGSDGFSRQTLVTLLFTEDGESTKLELTHEMLPSGKSLEEHSMGWSGSFESLNEVLHKLG